MTFDEVKSVFQKLIILILIAIIGSFINDFALSKVLAIKGEVNSFPQVILPDGDKIILAVARNKEQRIAGLGNVDFLPEDKGMIFIFGMPDDAGIWMKDMKIPIDIIWLDFNFNILDVKENILPNTFPEIFYPNKKAWYVIETNAGFIQKHKIKIGDKLKFAK